MTQLHQRVHGDHRTRAGLRLLGHSIAHVCELIASITRHITQIRHQISLVAESVPSIRGPVPLVAGFITSITGRGPQVGCIIASMSGLVTLLPCVVEFTLHPVLVLRLVNRDRSLTLPG